MGKVEHPPGKNKFVFSKNISREILRSAVPVPVFRVTPEGPHDGLEPHQVEDEGAEQGVRVLLELEGIEEMTIENNKFNELFTI